MVYKTTTILLLALLATNSWAQRGLHLGLAIKPQYTFLFNYDDKNFGTYSSRNPGIELNTHVYISHYFTDNFGIESGFGLQRVSTTFEAKNEQEMTGSTEVVLDYLTIPFSICGSSYGRRKWHLNYKLGAELLMLQNVEWRTNGSLSPRAQTIIPAGHYRKSMFNGIAAAGISYEIGWNIFAYAHIEISYSITDVEEKRNTDFWENERLYGSPANGAKTHVGTAGIRFGLFAVINAKDRHHSH